MARIAPYVFFQEFDNNGAPLDGGLLYTYEAGTTTPKVTYTDAGESTANANPIVLDASGRANVWLGTGAYKFVLHDSLDVPIDGAVKDDIVGEASNVFGANITSVSTNTAVTDVYKNGVIVCTAALTLSLLNVAIAEEGFLFTVKNSSSGQVTIDPDASETINGSATFILEAGESIIVECTGTDWLTLFDVPDDIIADTVTVDTVTADDIISTDFQADTTAGFNLKDSNGNTCLSGGAGGAANLTMGGNMSGASTHKLTNMVDGTSAQDYVTKNQLDTSTPASDSLAKFWVNFNGTGTPAIRGSYNVDSITDNGTGDYTIVITTDFADTNYSVVATASGITDAINDQILVTLYSTAPLAVGSVRIRTLEVEGGSSGNGFDDPEWVCVVGYGDQ